MEQQHKHSSNKQWCRRYRLSCPQRTIHPTPQRQWICGIEHKRRTIQIRGDAHAIHHLHSLQLFVFVMRTACILEIFTAFVVFQFIVGWRAKPIAAGRDLTLSLTCTIPHKRKKNTTGYLMIVCSLYQRTSRHICPRKSTSGYTSFCSLSVKVKGNNNSKKSSLVF